jgi:hypothetical protein
VCRMLLSFNTHFTDIFAIKLHVAMRLLLQGCARVAHGAKSGARGTSGSKLRQRSPQSSLPKGYQS